MVLQCLKYIAPIFVFIMNLQASHITQHTQSSFHFSSFCNLHSMFIVFMVLKIHMLGLLSHLCIVSLVFICLLSSSHLLTSDISLLLPSYIVFPFFTVTVLSILVAYAKSLFYSYLCIFIIFWTNGPEIINCMVLKYMEMSSCDQIPIHENWCLTIKVLDFLMAI